MEQDDESDFYEHFLKEVLFPILDLLTEAYGGGFIQTEEELDMPVTLEEALRG